MEKRAGFGKVVAGALVAVVFGVASLHGGTTDAAAAEDYQVWQSNFGAVAAADSDSATSDPEWKYLNVRRY